MNIMGQWDLAIGSQTLRQIGKNKTSRLESPQYYNSSGLVLCSKQTDGQNVHVNYPHHKVKASVVLETNLVLLPYGQRIDEHTYFWRTDKNLG